MKDLIEYVNPYEIFNDYNNEYKIIEDVPLNKDSNSNNTNYHDECEVLYKVNRLNDSLILLSEKFIDSTLEKENNKNNKNKKQMYLFLHFNNKKNTEKSDKDTYALEIFPNLNCYFEKYKVKNENENENENKNKDKINVKTNNENCDKFSLSKNSIQIGNNHKKLFNIIKPSEIFTIIEGNKNTTIKDIKDIKDIKGSITNTYNDLIQYLGTDFTQSYFSGIENYLFEITNIGNGVYTLSAQHSNDLKEMFLENPNYNNKKVDLDHNDNAEKQKKYLYFYIDDKKDGIYDEKEFNNNSSFKINYEVITDLKKFFLDNNNMNKKNMVRLLK